MQFGGNPNSRLAGLIFSRDWCYYSRRIEFFTTLKWDAFCPRIADQKRTPVKSREEIIHHSETPVFETYNRSYSFPQLPACIQAMRRLSQDFDFLP